MSEAIEAFVPVTVLAEDLVLVDWGPMTMTISVWDKGRARPVMAAASSRSALACLQVLSDFKEFLKIPVCRLPFYVNLPDVVSRAFTAALKVSDELTCLAAVAGAAADHVADVALGMGADKVIVNNGGDIALRLARGKTAVVGLQKIGAKDLAGRLMVRGGAGIGGVASSGWMGRSYSPGVADLVTVWAGTASIADAAATLIAGKTTAFGMNIEQASAAELDPTSDSWRQEGYDSRSRSEPLAAKNRSGSRRRCCSSHVLKGSDSWLLLVCPGRLQSIGPYSNREA